MYAERLAKRNRRVKRARALPEEEPAAAPKGGEKASISHLINLVLIALLHVGEMNSVVQWEAPS